MLGNSASNLPGWDPGFESHRPLQFSHKTWIVTGLRSRRSARPRGAKRRQHCVALTADGQWSANIRASCAALPVQRSADVGIEIALETLHALRWETFGELAQRSKAARVPIPCVISATMVRIADALLEFQVEGLPKQSLDMRGIAPG